MSLKIVTMFPFVPDFRQVSYIDEDQHTEVNAVVEIALVAFDDDELVLIYCLSSEPIEIFQTVAYFLLLVDIL